MRVKICGLTSATAVTAAAEAGAAYLGFVFFPRSPRAVTLEQARGLVAGAPAGPVKVALTVDADDALIDAITALGIDMHQLHGAETPARVEEVRARTGLPVMRAIGIREVADLADIDAHSGVADQILVDAKPPRGADRPGGNAIAFDWQLLAGFHWSRPWMLAGGLTPENVAEAVRLTGAEQVDVSSGVESAPGVKDPALVAAFIRAAQGAQG